MKTPGFIVGLILVAAAVLLLLFGGEGYSAGAVPLGVLGSLSIATSRAKSPVGP